MSSRDNSPQVHIHHFQTENALLGYIKKQFLEVGFQKSTENPTFYLAEEGVLSDF